MYQIRNKIVVHRFWCISFIWIGFLATACSASTVPPSPTAFHVSLISTLISTQWATPNIFNWGSTPTNHQSSMPAGLNCSIISASQPGLTWNQLTIGVSTFNEVEKILGYSIGWDTEQGNLMFTNSNLGPKADWDHLEACFVGDKLSAINIYGAGAFPRRLTELISKYGKPDRVTWSTDYYERSLVWGKEGLLVVFGVDIESLGNVILFSPIQPCELKTSWVLTSLPSKGQEHTGDVGRLRAEKEVEDPWGIEQLSKECP
jgi:hypothetical protein